jgi:hypothetical protein
VVWSSRLRLCYPPEAGGYPQLGAVAGLGMRQMKMNADQQRLKDPWCRGKLTALALTPWLLAASAGLVAQAEVRLPTSQSVLERMVKRAGEWAQDGTVYTYQKRSLLEQLDAEGKPIESVEKLYHVELIHGIPFPRLVKIHGRNLTQEQIDAENEKERAFRNRATGTDPGAMVDRKEPLLTHALLNRYRFTVERSETLDDRGVLVLAFRPRTDLPAPRTIQDRILSRLAGRVWVDEEEAEVARLEVTLTEAFSLGWLGWMGSLQQCELLLERERMSNGVWIPTRQSLLLVGRRLVSPLRYRTLEESYGFAWP